MKHITIIALLATSLFMAGCSTTSPLLTPAALTSEVSGGIQVGLDVYPAAALDVALARDIICVEATTGNITPQAIVNDLTALNITNSNSKLIVDGALLVYEGVYTALGTSTTAGAQPYLDALCAGFRAGLPTATATVKASQKILPPHLR
jgi:PBP1b-binding outer membrane lipoprotein LpoB